MNLCNRLTFFRLLMPNQRLRPFAFLPLFCVAVQSASAQSCFRPDSGKVQLLNYKNKADAYPHLSADGLRLYFTAQRDSGFGRMYIAERKSVDENFIRYRPLSENLEDGYFAGSLTADERTMYLCNGWRIYVAKRASKNASFSIPAAVEEIDRGFAPAVSPDGKALLIEQAEEDNGRY